MIKSRSFCKEEFFLKRLGRLMINLFSAVFLLRVIMYLKEPSFFAKSQIIDLILALLLISAVLLLLPYKRMVISIKDFFSTLEAKNEEEHVKSSINYFFQIVLIAYLAVLLISQFKEIYFNLNYLLLITLFLGVLSALFPPVFTKNIDKEDKRENGVKGLLYPIFLSISGFIIILIKTKNLGFEAYAIALSGGILIFILSTLILKDKK